MVKVHRLLIDDVSHSNAALVLPGDPRIGENPLLGKDSVLFSTSGPDNRNIKWAMTTLQKITAVTLEKHGPLRGAGTVFQRILVNGASYGPGNLISGSGLADAGVPAELLDAGLFQDPILVVVQEGTILTSIENIDLVESDRLAPAPAGNAVPVTNSLLPSQVLPGTKPEQPVNQQEDPGKQEDRAPVQPVTKSAGEAQTAHAKTERKAAGRKER